MALVTSTHTWENSWILEGDRYFWAAIIIIFVLLACFQSFKQINMYLTTPVATNIEAAYPNQIPFPVVAICNNNQYRLTYLTGPAIQNRKPKEPRNNNSVSSEMNLTVFDKVLENAWDMDAVKFLRNAAHWKSRMILSCTWPNGTNCRLSNFKAVWTLTGLCWAINTDPNNPHYISSSGSDNGLKLLLNIERYERVESCTPYFRTMSLPGLKILIYNQTDTPESSLDGVNVPPGYTMEIPFKMQKRHKYAGAGCVEKSEKYRTTTLAVDDPENVHTCIIRKYLHEIEKKCKCSMRRAYNPNPGAYSFCNVDQYFTCALPTLQFGKKRSFNRFGCPSPCDQIDYTAWQDMTLLPNSIFPSLIDTAEEEDVEDVVDDYDVENDANIELHRDEHFQCEENQLLSNQQVRQIKRAAQRAYEKQSRYQEDIRLRTKRMILKLQEATQKLVDNGWGWTDETYQNVFERLNKSITCFSTVPSDHAKMFAAIENPSSSAEEARISVIYRLLEPKEDISGAKQFHTVVQLREAFGDRFDEVVKEMQRFVNTITKLYKIYNPSFYKSTLGVNLKRMDTILFLANQYESGRLQRRAWAEKMQSRNMRHFFDQEFFENWYNPMLRDLDENLVRNIVDMADDELPNFVAAVDDGRGLQMGSMLYFGDTTTQHKEQFAAFVRDIVDCTFDDVKNESIILLNSFKKVMHEFQSAYSNLYQKELPAYLANFDFGSAFVEQNFAMVNVFLHRMNIETWRQESTYSIWSLACDVGGALGLFLGASLLTVIELIYSCCQYGLCNPFCCWPLNCWKNIKTHLANKSNKWKQKDKSEMETKLLDVAIKRSKSPISCSTSPKSTSAIMTKKLACAIDLSGNQLSTNSTPSHSSSINFTNEDNSSPNDFLFETNNLEKQVSMSSSRTLTNFPGQFSFESVSSEFSDKMATLFQPKNERQTFI
ncbi:amiloride-sensitive sodium channel family protein [Loa loa]|uniref:Amiloride-sensitive sodium channel family protein n=1 Tax=Loa loa TaxID=7209 RepID=A0A1S0TUP3_LOALO|nr:amiloride-sensitive sodium channel family protein [Loa loa]EFO20515.1 amiloride-sensitive sodium channel family protein [Loa loa]